MLWTNFVAVLALTPAVLAGPSRHRRDIGGAHHQHGHQHERRSTFVVTLTTTTTTTTAASTISRRPLSKLTTTSATTTPLSSSTTSSTTSSTAASTFSRRPLSKLSTTDTTTSSTTASTTTTSSSTTSTSSSTTSSSTTSSSTTTSAAATTVTGANAVNTVNANDGSANPRADSYVFYQGDGSAAAGWPTIDQWASYSTIKSRLAPYIGVYCMDAFGVPANSATETQQLYEAIDAAAAQSKVDHRLILATVMQESSGCVRAPTTQSADGTVRNPGLMQDFNGSGTCNENGVVQNPCPQATIQQMINDGTLGTPNYGLLQDLNANSAYVGAQAFYRASRIYNAGSIPASGDLGAPGATRCYCSDIANRLMGWVTATRTCNYS